MAKNNVRGLVDSKTLEWTNNVGKNGTGAAVSLASGDVIRTGVLFAVCLVAMTANAIGAVATSGRWKLKKATGVSYTRGQLLGYDFTNDRVTTNLSGGVCGTVTTAAATTDTTVEVNINDGAARTYTEARVVSAGEDTANQADFDIGFPAAQAAVFIQIKNTSNVYRGPAGAVTFPTANVVRVADANLAANEVIQFQAVQVASA